LQVWLCGGRFHHDDDGSLCNLYTDTAWIVIFISRDGTKASRQRLVEQLLANGAPPEKIKLFDNKDFNKINVTTLGNAQAVYAVICKEQVAKLVWFVTDTLVIDTPQVSVLLSLPSEQSALWRGVNSA